MQRRRLAFGWAWVVAWVAVPVWAGSDPAATTAAASATANATVTGGGAADRRGERLFLQCRACHSLGVAQDGRIGPPLGGVLGRKAAALPGFAYSKALAESGLTWDEPTLDRWLERPGEVVPGTSMVYAGLAKPEDRRQLLAYLKRATVVP